VGAIARRIPLPPRGTTIHCGIQQSGAVQRDARDHLGEVHVLTLARDVTMIKGSEDRKGNIHAAGVIQIGPSPASRGLPGQPREIGQSGERLGYAASGLIVVVSPRLTKAGLRDIDNIGLKLAQLLVSQAPVLHHPGAEVLDDNVRNGNETLDEIQATWASHVHSDPQLVGAGIVKLATCI
jgi:hypothetical protein